MTDSRLAREQAFHDDLAQRYGAGARQSVRALGDFWETPGGRVRFRRRLRMMDPLLSPGDHCLEIGCGFGVWSWELAKRVAALTAIDLSPDLIALAAEHPIPNVSFEVRDAHDTGLPAASFDKVVCVSSLHHLDLDRVLREIVRVLRPGGTLIASEPNMLNPQVALERSTPATRRAFGNSPDETAFIRWRLNRELRKRFRDVSVRNFDFYHPALGAAGNNSRTERFLEALEAIPILREISGSLFIVCRT